MGQSTDGQICYGVKFEEDFEFPWDDDPYLDEDDWWLEGASEAEIDEHRRDWLKAHPLPFELVNLVSNLAHTFLTREGWNVGLSLPPLIFVVL